MADRSGTAGQGAEPPRRLGPRPLMHHLGVAGASWIGCAAALPILSSDWRAWRAELQPAAAALLHDLDGASPEAFAAAVRAEGQQRVERFIAGVEAYRHHPYRRDLVEPPTAWAAGTTRLLDYGASGADGLPLLVVPSLINRGYVLDLSSRHSFLRWMALNGFRPFLVDWGAPGPAERAFDLTG